MGQKELSHTIQLHPSHFGPHMRDYLTARLKMEVEGTCSGRFGFIVCVHSIGEISKGFVLPCLGLAEFIVSYTAIVCKPFKGEVTEGVITSVNKIGIFVACGPIDVFVSFKVSAFSCNLLWNS